MKINFLMILLLCCLSAFAQQGKVIGLITEQDASQFPLPFVNVEVVGGAFGVVSDESGNYVLNLPAGNHILKFSYIGYNSTERPITVTQGETIELNISLKSDAMLLDAVMITTVQNREREVALLLEQKNAVSIKQVIGAQEMSRKGVSDAEGAVTKISGVSKQQGSKNVFVRGLGDRYNSTTMNGLPLPSEDPEYKNISLDFFSSDIIQSVDVNKTFSSTIYGDVGGANIDITSKELAGNKGIEVSISNGFNTRTIHKNNFLGLDGGTWFGNVENSQPPISDLNSYSFQNSLDTNVKSAPNASSITASGGYKFPLFNGNMSVFLVGNFSNKHHFQSGTIRQTTSVGTIFQDQSFEKYIYNVTQSGLGNFKYRFANNNTIAVNLLYIHNNTQDVSEYLGIDDPQEEGDIAFLRRQQMNDNTLFVTQLLSDIKVNEKTTLELATSFNTVQGNEPDRRSNSFLYRFGTYIPSTNSAGENERYFSELSENDFTAKAALTYELPSSDGLTRNVSFGYDFRNTVRDFDATIYNHRYLPPYLPEIDINNVDAIFNQQNLSNGIFELQTGNGTSSNPNVFDPFFYRGERLIHAGYGSIIYDVTEKLTTSAGLRFEKVNQTVSYDTNIASSATDGISEIDKNYFLPNVNIKYSVTERSNLRTAASLSYTLPQFKEVAPFKYQDVTFSSQGNPNLVPSENINIDLKYEFYPKTDELFAITTFYKNIKDPIARSEIPSGGNTLTYLNVGGQANVFGVELEMRKNIFKIENTNFEDETTLSFGANFSYLYSKQQLDNTLPQFTNTSDELQGAAPILANADITYRKSSDKFSITSAVVLNYFSDRIFSIGTRGFENVVEKGIPTLDFVSNATITKNWGLNLKLKNVLDPSFTLTRESNGSAPSATLSEFKRGVDISLGLTYIF